MNENEVKDLENPNQNQPARNIVVEFPTKESEKANISTVKDMITNKSTNGLEIETFKEFLAIKQVNCCCKIFVVILMFFIG